MEAKTIVTFIKAAELGSFSRTANVLGYSQAAVTVQIKQLGMNLARNCLIEWEREFSSHQVESGFFLMHIKFLKPMSRLASLCSRTTRYVEP